MEDDVQDAATYLARAEELAGTANEDGRWYRRWLVAFGVLVFALACAFAFLPTMTAVVVGMPTFGLGVAALVIYALTRRATIRNMGAVHALVMSAFGATWISTVTFGAVVESSTVVWLAGGGVFLAISIIAALLVGRRAS